MSSDAIRHTRKLLRRIQDHITHSQLSQNVRQESLGFVEVFYHPENKLPDFNHIAPRRKTAWIPAQQIQRGLDRLRELERTPRLQFLEGIFPPLFIRSLRDTGLELEREIGLMSLELAAATPANPPTLPPELSLEVSTDPAGKTVWWDVWQQPRYEIVTNLVEPLLIALEKADSIGKETRQDLILYRYDSPLAVVRLTTYEQSMNLSAMAIRKVAATPANLKLLYQLVLSEAVKQKVSLIFTAPNNAEARLAARQVGFVDSGAMVCYVEASELNAKREESSRDHVAESILLLR